MTKAYSVKGATALLFVALAMAGAIAAYLVANAKADGRTLDANFCGTPFICLSVASDQGTAVGEMGNNSKSVLALQPGVYWLTVNDNSNSHDFVLRSCPGLAVLCDPSQNTGDNEQQLTPLVNPADAPNGVVTETYKLNLVHGTYRLFCDAPARGGVGTHETAGMAVDILVGGVGQVGSGVTAPTPTVT